MWFPGGKDEADIRANIRDLKKKGADGVKIHHLDRDDFRIDGDEAKKQGLKIAHHVGVKDANAWDDADGGTTTIEHWYGVPDAALDGVQNFPAEFNYNNELHRFRYAGRLWREANPEKFKMCLNGWWKQMLHGIQRYVFMKLPVIFNAPLHNHGLKIFCIQRWNNSLHRIQKIMDHIFMAGQLQMKFSGGKIIHIWMQALRDFERMGGVITTGEDAGFIYQMFGFGYLRELQLHQEAGFHPLQVIQHATGNGAKVLGKANELGRIKAGYLADLIVVNGNPLENLSILMPSGIHPALDAQRDGKGGILWTIKDGIPYHAPTLFEEVKTMVREARATK